MGDNDCKSGGPKFTVGMCFPVGTIYNGLTITDIKFVTGRPVYICDCVCGKTGVAYLAYLVNNGQKQSCGCGVPYSMKMVKLPDEELARVRAIQQTNPKYKPAYDKY